LSLEGVAHLLWAFDVASAQVVAAESRLRAATGAAALTVGGEPYPGPGAVGREQLCALHADAAELMAPQQQQ
jgi:hypothetical protein